MNITNLLFDIKKYELYVFNRVLPKTEELLEMLHFNKTLAVTDDYFINRINKNHDEVIELIKDEYRKVKHSCMNLQKEIVQLITNEIGENYEYKPIFLDKHGINMFGLYYKDGFTIIELVDLNKCIDVFSEFNYLQEVYDEVKLFNMLCNINKTLQV